MATRVGGGEPCRLVGRHCESGDTLSADVPLDDPRVGDLIAVPVTGAYTYSLSNNYNGARRPRWSSSATAGTVPSCAARPTRT
ncbi:hypothetical protein ACFQZC_27955 [Streptacidiphilus monticola]